MVLTAAASFCRLSASKDKPISANGSLFFNVEADNKEIVVPPIVATSNMSGDEKEQTAPLPLCVKVFKAKMVEQYPTSNCSAAGISYHYDKILSSK